MELGLKFFENVHQFDIYLLNRLMNIKNRQQWSSVARFISITGDAYFYIGFAIWLGYTGETRWLYVMLVSFGLERLIYFSAKHGFKRNRPEQAIADFDAHIKPADEFSFPSGHSSAAFLMITLLVLIYGPVVQLLFIWAALVALSRMMLGLHFPSDLIMGAATGIVSVLAANYLVSV